MADQMQLPGMPAPAEPPTLPALSADVRRTIRQKAIINRGGHPLGLALTRPLPLHPRAIADGRLCGNCRFRKTVDTGSSRQHPKCLIERGPTSLTWMDCPYPRVSAGAGTDVRRWWPGCVDHEWGDPALSTDAARSGPADGR